VSPAIVARGLGKRHYLDGRAPLWALREASFEVKPGEVIGVLGRNGAGKTTLLKLLAGVTEPSEGEVELRGRVAPILESGAAFHPELTGRENVLLGGVVLGLRRRDVARRLDAIVAFAGLEDFLDVPLKRYSSGMYVRLAFALATHLEAEILLLDEALAVADAGFRRKCAARIRDLAAEGRSVLFASHDARQVEAVCSDALLLERGRLVERGSVASLTARLQDDPAVAGGDHVRD
jgi:lipopolysaccharide transport system ATP-binding protein